MIFRAAQLNLKKMCGTTFKDFLPPIENRLTGFNVFFALLLFLNAAVALAAGSVCSALYVFIVKPCENCLYAS